MNYMIGYYGCPARFIGSKLSSPCRIHIVKINGKPLCGTNIGKDMNFLIPSEINLKFVECENCKKMELSRPCRYTKIHIVKVNGKPLCGTNIGKNMNFLIHSVGINLKFVECKNCKKMGQKLLKEQTNV